MSVQVNPRLNEPMRTKSPYCADPNCIFCKELRAVYEALTRGTSVPHGASALRNRDEGPGLRPTGNSTPQNHAAIG